MRPVIPIILGLLTFLLIFSACPGPGRSIEGLRKVDTGRLVVYLEGPPILGSDIAVTFESVYAVDVTGALHPFVTQPRRMEAHHLTGRQVLLGEALLPAGSYRGLHFTFSEALLRRGPRVSHLSYPQEGWTLETPFEVRPRDIATLFLYWDTDRSLEMGFFFSPSLSAARETRQLRQLLVYVSNESSDTVSVINRDTGRVVATLAVARGPRGLASSPDSKSLYVVSSRAGRLAHFRTTTNKRLMEFRFELGSEPQDVAVSPDNSRVFVTLYRLDRLVILDANSMSRLGEVEVGKGPQGVIVEPQGRKVYVANSRSNTVSVISAQTATLLATVSVEPKPQRFAVTPDGTEILVTGYNSAFLTAISVATNRVTRRLHADRWVTDIAVEPRLNRYYFVQDRTNSLLFYEPNSQLSIQTISVNSNPSRVTLDPDLRTLFVVSRNTNTVTILDRITGEVEGVLEVGKLPYDIEVVEVP